MVHSFGVVLSLFPWRITLSSFVMIVSVLVNVHVQSASHSFPMLRRLVVPKAGNRSV